ncbi:RagB/SusD family nutrient uptake outer membrane protein [Mariniflexile ostreae]|uniref:RagB/SusD family nutrient uptake outer membrane protein n=1 Tax=Mariniflexile ostreae TaxID=1520892 RepID=A0ABV5F9N8_9FLAO
MKQYTNIFLSLLVTLALFTSCESLLDVEPEEVLLEEDYLGDDKLDARSALFGVLSQMQDIVGQYVALGEMRADLVDVTPDTEDDLRQINAHNITADNSYVDPSILFSIINNCNFALKGMDIEAYDGVLEDDYASIMRIRTWAQMQILIHYGKLPYITKPIATTDHLKEEYPLLTFSEGIDQLILNLESVTGIENVTKYESSLGYNIFNMIPDNDVLLGDLYLWKKNYVSAAIHYKAFLDKNVDGGASLYNLAAYTVNTTLSGGKYSTTTSWPSIFSLELPASQEIINYVAFSDQYRQPNGGFDIITKQMKPSALILQNWLSQKKSFEGVPYDSELPQFPGDNRLLGSVTGTVGVINFSWTEETARIYKYNYEYFTWNRAARIYLRFAEAINFAGYPQQALAIVNGIFNTTEPANAAPLFTNVEPYLNFPIGEYYTANSSGVPTAGNQGIRGRVDMAAVSVDPNLSEMDAIEAVGQLILNEAALELAFEGTRWEDLLRFSMRNNNPSILADAVASKFGTVGDVATANQVQQKLMNPDNWFLPLTIPENFVPKNN